eukprot:scaffold60976_cov48-Attheya_sp.AAC.1
MRKVYPGMLEELLEGNTAYCDAAAAAAAHSNMTESFVPKLRRIYQKDDIFCPNCHNQRFSRLTTHDSRLMTHDS